MVLTHDLDISGSAPGLSLASNQKNLDIRDVKELPNQNQVNNQQNILKENSELSTQYVQIPPNTSEPITPYTQIPAKHQSKLGVDDPFRELVLCSKIEDCVPDKLNELATRAANLHQTEEITIKQNASGNVKALAGIFSGTEALVKKVETTIRKKYSVLDPSDSEGYGGTY